MQGKRVKKSFNLSKQLLPLRQDRAWRHALAPYAKTVLAVGATFVAVGLLQSIVVDFQSAILLYLLPVVLAASRWGRAPAVVGVGLSILGQDLFFVEPRGTFVIGRVDDALSLLLLLFTALVTAQLADGARRGAEAAHEAALVRRSDELKASLLRAVTHNLRTPLASIKASVSGLRQPGASYAEADRAELLAEIEEETDHLDRLVTNLLDASRLEAGGLTLSTKPQDLGELLETVVDRLSLLFEGRRLTVDIPEALPSVWCDYVLIDHVVANLLENAARHTPPGTPVCVRAAVEDDRLRVEVEDHGRGVPTADRGRLFRPFERGQTRSAGTGLGLAIARGFVEAHGGRLWVEDATGSGARFVFTLPMGSDRP